MGRSYLPLNLAMIMVYVFLWLLPRHQPLRLHRHLARINRLPLPVIPQLGRVHVVPHASDAVDAPEGLFAFHQESAVRFFADTVENAGWSQGVWARFGMRYLHPDGAELVHLCSITQFKLLNRSFPVLLLRSNCYPPLSL